MDKYNRRHSPRQRKEATIQILLFSDDPKVHRDSNDFIPVKMCNQIDEGLYIEIKCPANWHNLCSYQVNKVKVLSCNHIKKGRSKNVSK